MASSKHNDPAAATPKAVLKYAMELRHRAAAARLNDPHVELYSPSVDTARKLCSQHGPAGALNVLATRARRAEQRHEEEEARADAGRERLRSVQLVEAEERRVFGDASSWGRRLDVALLALRVQSDVPAAVLDGDIVSGGKPSSGSPRSRADRSRENAIEDATRAVVALEREVERSRRRMVEREAA